MTRQFITLSDKIFIEILYLKYLYLQILFDKFSKDAFSVRLCVENWGPWPPCPPVAWALKDAENVLKTSKIWTNPEYEKLVVYLERYSLEYVFYMNNSLIGSSTKNECVR